MLPWLDAVSQFGSLSRKRVTPDDLLGMEEVRGSIPLRSTNATIRTPFGAFFFESSVAQLHDRMHIDRIEAARSFPFVEGVAGSFRVHFMAFRHRAFQI